MTEPIDPAKLAELEAQYPRGFRAIWPDGFTVHGVQFPSGRCVVDSVTYDGLWKAAVSLAALELHESARIEWDDAAAAVARGRQQAIDALRDAARNPDREHWCRPAACNVDADNLVLAAADWLESRAATPPTEETKHG